MRDKRRRYPHTSALSLPGPTFWERHEANTAANPPTSEGICVLIALKWTVKEPSWYFGVFVQICNEKKDSRWTGFIKKRTKTWITAMLSYGNESEMPLQHINSTNDINNEAESWWGRPGRLFPSPDMFTLWRHVYYIIESRVTGKTTFSSESPTDVFYFL